MRQTDLSLKIESELNLLSPKVLPVVASPGHKLGKPIGIGQNDVWIAALAKTANAELVTIDGDFEHLNNTWINVHKF